MEFSVTILGNGSAVPTATQNPAAQLLKYNGKRFLIDCGDGTQMQFIKYHAGFRNLNHIFISHMHGDHFFGLQGLLSTFHLFGRKEALHIYGPPELKTFLDVSFTVSNTLLIYPLIFHATELKNKIIYEDKELEIYTIPLKHSAPTTGFLFLEKEKKRKIKKKFISDYHPSIEKIKLIKSGGDFRTKSGETIKNEEITNTGRPPRKYAYCSDTAYSEEIIPLIEGANLLYHEATFDNSTREKALERLHSTATQAATIAKKAKVKKLLLGHYSARLNNDFSRLLEEAQSVFPSTELSIQGETYEV